MVKKKAAKSTSSDKTIDFEKSMRELEKLVEHMEKGDLSLEESLQDFERGVELTRLCQTALKDAEQKVQQLVKSAGKDALTPFTEDQDT